LLFYILPAFHLHILVSDCNFELGLQLSRQKNLLLSMIDFVFRNKTSISCISKLDEDTTKHSVANSFCMINNIKYKDYLTGWRHYASKLAVYVQHTRISRRKTAL